jgi:hypothetical protein
MSVLKHKMWRSLKPFIVLEPDGTRNRIEFAPMPTSLRRSALRCSMKCVACGRRIRFVRSRTPGGRKPSHNLYFAPTCPLNVRIGCSRGTAARNEYKAVAWAVNWQP